MTAMSVLEIVLASLCGALAIYAVVLRAMLGRARRRVRWHED